MPNPPPTLISTFEILFTPQLPPGLGPAAVAQADEYVVKGYFLTVGNPNPNAYTFTLGFHCNVNPTPVPAQRLLTSAVGFLDDGTTGTPLTLTQSSTTPTLFSTTIRVAANGTVLVGILPAFFTGTGLATPTIECRGWVDVTLPALLSGRPLFLRFVPQSGGPVTALFTPEQRLTFLPAPGDAATAVEAQSAFGLPLASGAAAVAVPPQPGGPLIFQPLADVTGAEAAEAGALATASPAVANALLEAMVSGAPAVANGDVTPEQAMQMLGYGH